MTLRTTALALSAFFGLYFLMTPALCQQAAKPKPKATGMRIWKNSAGKEIQASLVRINRKSESVDLKLKTGRPLQVKMQDLVEKHLLRGRKPAELQNDIAEALQKKGQRVIFR